MPQARVDDAALRVLRQLVRFGQGRDPRDYRAEVIGCAAHRALAREAAQKGIVLLKNEGNAAAARGHRAGVAVIGRLADTPNTGDRGSSNTQPPYVITPLEGLRAALGATSSPTTTAATPPRGRRRGGADAACSSWSATPSATRASTSPPGR